jgi:ABC-type branched-subunit amino acid transport system ATPase component
VQGAPGTAESSPAFLATQDLFLSFGGTRAVDGVSLSIEAGVIVGLIGPNGAGKTTLLNAVTGLLPVDAGHVFFDGQDITSMRTFRRSRLGIARTFQQVRMVRRLSALENVRLSLQHSKGETAMGALFGRHRGDEARRLEEAHGWLDYVGLADNSSQLAGTLSYGQQKLLTLACCLAIDARLLLLDEPVAGVNPAIVARILDLLNHLCCERDMTILFIDHNIDAVMQISHKVIAMDRGRIIADGTPDAVRNSTEVIETFLS